MVNEPQDHTTDRYNRYFSMANTKGTGKKSRQMLSYPSFLSALRLVPHSEKLPPPAFSGFGLLKMRKLNQQGKRS